MSIEDVGLAAILVVLPLGVVAWHAFAPARSVLAYWVQFAATGLFLVVLLLVPVWLMPPWWTPFVYIVLWIAATCTHILLRRIPTAPRIPTYLAGWTPTLARAGLVAWCTASILTAIAGRFAPDRTTVDLSFPLGPGDYLVASGGSTETVNGHFLTLNPRTERQRSYRGQSYAVDLIQIDKLGLRSQGWRPSDPARYEIFGAPVFAPCAGTVLAAGNGMRDLRVPETDTSRLEGNHVFIDCGGFGVLLGHLQRGTVRVGPGDLVAVGQQVGEAGNSGQSSEPHLHIHAQRLAGPEAPLLSGEPLFLRFAGRFPVRNDRISITARSDDERKS